MTHFFGIDVGKDFLDIAYGDSVTRIPNTPQAIKDFFAPYKKNIVVGLEATNVYHYTCANLLAKKKGYQVYVLNPYRVYHFKRFKAISNKTDSIDAQVVLACVQLEHIHLHAYEPQSRLLSSLRTDLVSRDAIVKAEGRLNASAHRPGVSKNLRTIAEALKKGRQKLDQQLAANARQLKGYEELSSIPSVGPLNVALLLHAFHTHTFEKPSDLVAFFGFNVVQSQSGTSSNRASLNWRGDALSRRGLFMAGCSALTQTKAWKPYVEHYRAQGKSDKEIMIILARLILRVAWALFYKGERFSIERLYRYSTVLKPYLEKIFAQLDTLDSKLKSILRTLAPCLTQGSWKLPPDFFLKEKKQKSVDSPEEPQFPELEEVRAVGPPDRPPDLLEALAT